MTLMITLFAAVISTILWYRGTELKLGSLCLIYWGASLMWLVDGIAEFAEAGAEIFTPSAGVMLNDAFLGFAAVLLGLIIWLAGLLISDPLGKIKAISEKKE